MDNASDSIPGLRLPVLRLERSQLLDIPSALRQEWLVTNGLGGYASGSVLGVDTRRYHGLLFAALQPPVRRTLLLARVHEGIESEEDIYSLSTAEYHDGTLQPAGHIFLEEFRLEGMLPVWRYRCRDVEVEKTLWLEQGRSTLFLRYRLLTAPGVVRLRVEPFVACRDIHSHTRGDVGWRFGVESHPDGCRVEGFPGATLLWLKMGSGKFIETGLWYWHFLHREERERGFDDLEDLYTPGVFGLDLVPGETATLVASTHPEDLDLDPANSYERERARQSALLRRAGAPEDPVFQRLVLAADQFITARGAEGRSLIAGYHWFAERGRDSMVALPGLCLETGRAEDARALLATFAGYFDRGLLPQWFPEEGTSPEYASADASLWFIEAVARYEQATGDPALVDELLPRLVESLDWYQRGTHHGIAVDPKDGLLRASAPGLPLTWMDARVGDWLVTARHGKPVELEALWYNALRHLAGWLRERGQDSGPLELAAERCRESFNSRFWDPNRRCCYDVVDGADADCLALRPNQLLAAGLAHPILDAAYWEPMLSIVERELLTPVGLRSLAPTEMTYAGSHAGHQVSRDIARHQGAAWPWLIGPYLDVVRRARGENWDVRPALEGMARHLGEAGLGQVSELFSGDPPHQPGGCIAQAWSVAELLRVWPRSSSRKS